MVAKYPQQTTAAKKQGRAPRAPRDFQTGGRPRSFPQNDNVPLRSLSRKAMAMLARKLGLKLIPYIGWADTAWDLYEWLNGQPVAGLRPTRFPDWAWAASGCTSSASPRGTWHRNSNFQPQCTTDVGDYWNRAPNIWGDGVAVNSFYTTWTSVYMHGSMGDDPARPDPFELIRRVAQKTTRAGVASPYPTYAFSPPSIPLGVPGVYPLEWPLALPQAAPRPHPAPGKPNNPAEEPAAEPDPEAAPYPWPEAVPYRIPPNAPGIWTFPWPGTPQNPGIFPQPDMVVLEQPTAGRRSRRRRRTNAGSGIATRAAGGRTRRQQPKRRKYRDKPNVRSVGGAVWTGFNFATETIDFAEVLWDGIPVKYQTKGASLAQKYEDIWKHYNKIDLAAAVVAYANNQFEDYLYGQYGKHQGRAMNRIGGATGLSRALRNAGAYDGEAAHAIDPNAEQANLSQLIPHIDFDPNTGQVGLTVPAIGGVSVNLGNRVL